MLRETLGTLGRRGRLVQHALRAPELGQQSFSQCGEDLILKFAFHSLGVFRPTYLDIGAHHPYRLSNTALFYQSGSRGVNVEPNPALHREFLRRRPGDINLNLGVGTSQGTLDFYVMNNPELSTFCPATAEQYRALQGAAIQEVVPVQVVPINEILEQNSPANGFDLISIDVEGLDAELISAIDYTRFAPLAICVESIDFATGEKCGGDMAAVLNRNGYVLFADTYINAIYFHDSRFRARRKLMCESMGARKT